MRFDANAVVPPVVILAGGKGTRLQPYTTILPKPLIPIGDMPVMEILIRQLAASGFTDVTLSVGYLASLMEAYFGDGGRWGVRLAYSREEEPLGTAAPLRLLSRLHGTFLVMNGDLLTDLSYVDLVERHRRTGAVVSVGLARKRVQIDLGVVESDASDAILGYTEKPILEYEVSMGIYAMEPEALNYVPRSGAFDLPDLIKALIAADRPVAAYRFDGLWLDIGRPDDCAEAVEVFERQRSAFLPHEEA
jgi:NDP-sugar pyrophosphorylase family protein